ncbi:NRT1/ PTR family 4.3-like protein [Tanacetum coccineum]
MYGSRGGGELSTRNLQKMVQALPQYNEPIDKLSIHVDIAAKINKWDNLNRALYLETLLRHSATNRMRQDTGVQAFEIMAIAAVSNNLIIYAINEMNFSLSKAANIVTMLYRTLTYLPQLKPPRCNMLTDGDRCIEAMEVEALIFFLPLYLVALGNGCMKHNMLAHGADQFNKSDSK